MDPSNILNEEAYDMYTAARWIANTQADHGTADLPLKSSVDLVVKLLPYQHLSFRRQCPSTSHCMYACMSTHHVLRRAATRRRTCVCARQKHCNDHSSCSTGLYPSNVGRKRRGMGPRHRGAEETFWRRQTETNTSCTPQECPYCLVTNPSTKRSLQR